MLLKLPNQLKFKILFAEIYDFFTTLKSERIPLLVQTENSSQIFLETVF